eukprot:Opistho-2@56892
MLLLRLLRRGRPIHPNIVRRNTVLRLLLLLLRLLLLLLLLLLRWKRMTIGMTISDPIWRRNLVLLLLLRRLLLLMLWMGQLRCIRLLRRIKRRRRVTAGAAAGGYSHEPRIHHTPRLHQPRSGVSLLLLLLWKGRHSVRRKPICGCLHLVWRWCVPQLCGYRHSTAVQLALELLLLDLAESLLFHPLLLQQSLLLQLHLAHHALLLFLSAFPLLLLNLKLTQPLLDLHFPHEFLFVGLPLQSSRMLGTCLVECAPCQLCLLDLPINRIQIHALCFLLLDKLEKSRMHDAQGLIKRPQSAFVEWTTRRRRSASCLQPILKHRKRRGHSVHKAFVVSARFHLTTDGSRLCLSSSFTLLLLLLLQLLRLLLLLLLRLRRLAHFDGTILAPLFPIVPVEILCKGRIRDNTPG